MIRFETFQYITFILSSSLFLYFTVGFLNWFIDTLKVKKVSALSRIVVSK